MRAKEGGAHATLSKFQITVRPHVGLLQGGLGIKQVPVPALEKGFKFFRTVPVQPFRHLVSRQLFGHRPVAQGLEKT